MGRSDHFFQIGPVITPLLTTVSANPPTLDKTKVRMGGRILKKKRVMLVFRGLPQIKIKPTEAIREVFNGCDEFKGFE